MSSEIVKTCTKHGELAIDKVYPRSDNPKGFRCKACAASGYKRYYARNRDNELKKRKTRLRPSDQRERKAIYSKRSRDKLSGAYIRYQLAKRSPLEIKDIPDELVRIKRVSMQIKRILKEREATNEQN